MRREVWHGVGGIAEERAVLGIADELQSAICHQVVTVVLVRHRIVRDLTTTVIGIEILGEVVVRVILVEVTEPVVKALVQSRARCARVTQ